MEDKLAILKYYETVVEAEVDMNVLQTNDIDCTIDGVDAVVLYPIFSEQDNRIKILVFEKDLEQSLRLVEEFHTEADDKSVDLELENEIF